MGNGKMHADEAEVDEALVRRLLTTQLPGWASLPLRRVPSAGTDNAMYRLGDDLAVRLPRRERAAHSADKEARWLPALAPLLPLAIPVPIAFGGPIEEYPWPWYVHRWLPGDDATEIPIAEDIGAAQELAVFVKCLHGVDLPGGPGPGAHNFFRGVPLIQRDTRTREAIEALGGSVDTEVVSSAWRSAVSAPPWAGPPVWIHGDLVPGNLLVRDGRLSAVIDFGGLAVGDPACDMLAAWRVFAGPARQAFRDVLSVDDATWARSRGWALSTALIEVPYYERSNPLLVSNARRTIAEVVADQS